MLKNKIFWIVVAVVVLALAGGGYYYYTTRVAPSASAEASEPELASLGSQPVDLCQYDRLLGGR